MGLCGVWWGKVADVWVSALRRKPLPGVKSGTEVTAEALEAVGVLHDEGLVKAVLTDLVALAEGAELEPHTRPKGERRRDRWGCALGSHMLHQLSSSWEQNGQWSLGC